MPELYDLVERYQPELVWSDGEWEAHSDYWQSRDFLHWYSTRSAVAETAVWNDRWGSDTLCKHGGFLTCLDRYLPDSLVAKKWEDCLTVDRQSWGYNRRSQIEDYMTVPDLIRNLIESVAKNGNLLLNVGPASDGTIHPIFVDRLLGLGSWLAVNGEGIYNTTVWKVCQNETASSAFYTRTHDTLYVLLTKWPTNGAVNLDCPIPTAQTRARMLGLESTSSRSASSSSPFVRVSPGSSPDVEGGSGSSGTAVASRLAGLTVELPSLTPDIIPCQHAWVVALTGIANL
jgi:alpha-L-fucosidase